jgi:PqqD family protein of HPr-rel-A system
MEGEGSQPDLDPADTEPDGSGTGFSVPVDYVPRRHANVLELDLEDGLILYDRDSSLVHHLNPSARIVWFLCDGSASVRELAQEIADEYGLDPGPIRSQVADLVGELDAVGLLEDASPPSGDRGIS